METDLPKILGNNVLIEIDPDFSARQFLTSSSELKIILPGQEGARGHELGTKNLPHWGKIVGLGDGDKVTLHLRESFTAGKRVFIGQFQGQKISWRGKEYNLCEPQFVFMSEP